jgi:hypothetical protein
MISSVEMIASTSSMTTIGGILVRIRYVAGVYHTRNWMITPLLPEAAAAVRAIWGRTAWFSPAQALL